MEQLFKECCDFIDAEYQRLDHTLGYRFLTCSHTLLNPDIKLLYLSQSPAGSTDIKEHPKTSCEYGSPFFVERWDGDTPGTSSLQQQTQGMFSMLQAQLKIPGTVRDFAEQHILSGYFVPFRCKGLDNLKNKKGVDIRWISAYKAPRSGADIGFGCVEICEDGGIGRRASLRGWSWFTGWGFDPPSSHFL